MPDKKRVLVVVDPTATYHDYAPHAADPRSHGAANSAAPLRSGGLEVETDARWDYPLYDSVVRKAQESRADFVIKDTHFHSALKRGIFSNTDWSLIRNCAATLWLVKPRPPGKQPCFVAAVDPLHERNYEVQPCPSRSSAFSSPRIFRTRASAPSM